MQSIDRCGGAEEGREAGGGAGIGSPDQSGLPIQGLMR